MQKGFPYRQAMFENIACGICGRRDEEELSDKDRNGLSVRTVICRYCGMIYRNPRMTSDWYKRYYQEAYREQMAWIRGLSGSYNASVEERRGHQQQHALLLIDFIGLNLLSSVSRVLEIGSGPGGVLQVFRERLNCRVQGVEPSASDACHAEAMGVRTAISLFEDFQVEKESYDLIICSKTIDHLMDPIGSLRHAWQLLRKGGLIFVDCLNFVHYLSERRNIWLATQIDHVTHFTPETFRAAVECSRFEVIRQQVDAHLDLSFEEQRGVVA